MQLYLRPFICLLPLVFGLVASVPADQLILGASQDTGLSQHSPGTSFGSFPDVVVGTRGVNVGHSSDRGIFRFDVSTIPSNATITTVRVGLTATKESHNGAPDDESFGLHRMLTAWSESLANWNVPETGGSWGAPGGLAGVDFATTASASVLVDGVHAYELGPNDGLKADVQLWRTNVATNRGWMFKAAVEGTNKTARYFTTRDGLSGQPQLVVDFTLPAPIPTITHVAKQGSQFTFDFNAEAGKAYRVECRTNIAAGLWLTATNVPAVPIATNVAISLPIQPLPRLYRVATP